MKYKSMTVYVPEDYKKQINNIKEEYDLTMSQAYRHIYGLDQQEFAFHFSAKEKPLLLYIQTISVILFGFEDYIKRQVTFYREKKNKVKEKFYEWIFRRMSAQRSFIVQTLLPSLEEGFEGLTDKAATKQLDLVEAMCYIIEHGDRKTWDGVKKLAQPYMNKQFIKK